MAWRGRTAGTCLGHLKTLSARWTWVYESKFISPAVGLRLLLTSYRRAGTPGFSFNMAVDDPLFARSFIQPRL